MTHTKRSQKIKEFRLGLLLQRIQDRDSAHFHRPRQDNGCFSDVLFTLQLLAIITKPMSILYDMNVEEVGVLVFHCPQSRLIDSPTLQKKVSICKTLFTTFWIELATNSQPQSVAIKSIKV